MRLILFGGYRPFSRNAAVRDVFAGSRKCWVMRALLARPSSPGFTQCCCRSLPVAVGFGGRRWQSYGLGSVVPLTARNLNGDIKPLAKQAGCLESPLLGLMHSGYFSGTVVVNNLPHCASSIG